MSAPTDIFTADTASNVNDLLQTMRSDAANLTWYAFSSSRFREATLHFLSAALLYCE